jgi:hypothetical protein
MVRRLAREAVIFMLLGMMLAAVGSFIYMSYSQAVSFRVQRDALKQKCDLLARGPAGATSIEKDGTVLVNIAECGIVFGTDPAHGGYIDISAGLVPKQQPEASSAAPSKKIEGLPADAVLKPLPPASMPDNFLAQQQDMITEGTRIKNLKMDNLGNAVVAAFAGMYGFAAGFGVWLFYRLVRFAVKG